MEPRELFRLGDLPLAVHGEVLFSAAAVAHEETSLVSVCIDSRQCREGSLFVALPGACTDGHRHVGDALSRGAVAAVVSTREDPLSGQEWSLPVVCVQDTLVALHQLAGWYCRTHLAGIFRIGVTGSNGKTTTKEMIAAILRCAGPTSASFGNLNSETGVPLALFQTDREARYAVYEMAMSNPGEMVALADMVRPDLAVITNIGVAHIGNLGSQEAIAREKKAIASCFDGSQSLLVPEDDPFCTFLQEGVSGQVLTFGVESQKASFEAGDEPGEQRICVEGEWYTLPLEGAHNGRNALAAVAVARVLEIGADCLHQGFRTLRLPSGRSEVLQGREGILILNDSYNANPESCHAALETVASLHAQRLHRGDAGAGSHLVLILGEMAELGSATVSGHRSVLEQAISLGPALVLLVGALDREGSGAEESAWDRLEQDQAELFHRECRVLRFASVEDVLAQGVLLPQGALLAGGETLLLKGSRSAGLELLLPSLVDPDPAGAGPVTASNPEAPETAPSFHHPLKPEASDDA